MAKFINKIKELWSILKNATKYQVWLFVGTLIFMFIFDILGMSILTSIIFGLFVGNVIEGIHCYIPNDTIDTDGIYFNYFNVVAIILYCILKILYVIIF